MLNFEVSDCTILQSINYSGEGDGARERQETRAGIQDGSSMQVKYLNFDFYAGSQCPTGRVFQYRVGSGRVLEKIPGSGSGSGRVGVLKYTSGYFRVSFLLSGISGYSWVFPGISGENWISSLFFEVVSQTLRFFSNIAKIHK